jgi:hypothetical protein
MNEVNIYYCFRDLFPKKLFLSIFWTNKDFLSQINRFLREKKIRRSTVYRDFMAVQMENFVRFLKDPFKLKNSFWNTGEIGLTVVSFNF